MDRSTRPKTSTSRTRGRERIWNAWPRCCESSALSCEELRETPFQLDARSLSEGGNFTFDTSLGSVDILAFPAGAPAYEQVRHDATVIDVEGRRARVASLDHLIAMKEAAGRPKDLLAASEYRVLADELNRRGRP